VLSLADLGHLRVETTDLNEIDVARLDVGNNAIITFDALPNVSVEGKVVRIAPKASEGSGVNYTAVVELDEIPQAALEYDGFRGYRSDRVIQVVRMAPEWI
jgi:HlyD family secretion protein